MILATLLAGTHLALAVMPNYAQDPPPRVHPIQYYGPPPGYYAPPVPRYYPYGGGEYAPYPRYMPRGGMLYPEDRDMINREDWRMRQRRYGPPMGW